MARQAWRLRRLTDWGDSGTDPLYKLHQREQQKHEIPLRRCAVEGCQRKTRATLCAQHRLMPSEGEDHA